MARELSERIRAALDAWEEPAPPGWDDISALSGARGGSVDMPFDGAMLLRLANARMPFGKYSGRLLIELPEAYVVWFARNGYPKGELGALMAALYEIKANGMETFLRPLVRD
jgi:uncharacterized protein (DUF3820 family)